MLNVGSQSTSFGPGSVNLDRILFPGVAVAGDAHDLPFPDGSFDTCVLSAVLQYCRSPARVVAEAARVLAAGGHLVIDAPFIQPYCPEVDAFDLWRFTEHGLRVLCEPHVRVLSCTVAIGTASAVAHTLQTAFGSGTGRVRRFMLRYAVSLPLWPLAWVRHYYSGTAGALVLVGRKETRPG